MGAVETPGGEEGVSDPKGEGREGGDAVGVSGDGWRGVGGGHCCWCS